VVKTVWVLGDQLNRRIGALADATPDDSRVLLVESEAMLHRRRFHRQRLHLVVAAMRRFALELEGAGFTVDLRRAPTLQEGVRAHADEFDPEAVVATEPNSPTVEALLRRLDVELARSNQFLCHRDDFADWAGDRTRLRLEDFYRWQRRRLGYLMDGDSPTGGAWNFDHDNREPPPPGGGDWPRPPSSRLDELDREVLDELPPDLPGADPVGWWATSRRAALARLRHFVDEALPSFGPYEDAMVADNWHLAHSLLSPSLNLGLLLPDEVCDAVEDAYRQGRVPINSAEGMIRQVIGWREFVWGIFWLWPDQQNANTLQQRRHLPPSWTGDAATSLRCLAVTLDGLHERGWVHHIQRLMVLSNFANLYGIDPRRVRDWMREQYVDGADWVMGPNVMGMGMWADGGRMATKPYVSGGAYVNRMSDYCDECRFDPKKRVGDDACPFTTLYWDFLDRHRDQLEPNARLARQYHTLERLSDLDDVRNRAQQVIVALREGRL
jgi:deoxyribodipyrimidine photolyase-related protein